MGDNYDNIEELKVLLLCVKFHNQFFKESDFYVDCCAVVVHLFWVTQLNALKNLELKWILSKEMRK